MSTFERLGFCMRNFDYRYLITGFIVFLFMFVVLLAANMGRSDMTRGAIDVDFDNAKSSEEIQAELDVAGLDAGVELYMNSNIMLLHSKAPANLLIQNSEKNKNNQQVFVYLGSELLYKSDIIPPGYKIESAKLLSELDSGEYDCRVEFHVLDPDNNDKAVINTSVKITVLR